jgi:hypothetical protein
MIIALIQLLLSHVHLSTGPHGAVLYIQPPHVAAGIGMVRGQVVTWFQVR